MFTHSLPLAVADRCYITLLKKTRRLIVEATGKKKQEETYQLLLNIIEEYNIRLLSGKVYWDKQEEKEEYKEFWNKYQKIDKLKKKQYIQYMAQREILFVRADLKKLRTSKKDNSEIIKFYKQKLVENGDMRAIKNAYTTKNGRYVKVLTNA